MKRPPATIDALVAQVVRRTHLRRRERADLGRELRSHFDEGIAAGRSESQLIEAFGDPRAAAKQLRAAAIAKRPAWDRAIGATVRGAAWTVAAVVLAYVGFGAWLTLQRPQVKFDAFERLRAAVPQAGAEGEALPRYTQALASVGIEGTSWRDRRGPNDPSPLRLFEPLPGSPEWEESAQWLDANAPFLQALREASALAVLGGIQSSATGDAELLAQWKDASRFPLFELRLPWLGPMRLAAAALCADALRAAERSDGDRVVADLVAAMGVARQAQESRILICDLVGHAIRARACTTLLQVLEWKPDLLHDAQLQALQRCFGGVDDALMQFTLAQERLSFEDLVQRIFTDDGAGDGWLRPDERTAMALGAALSMTSSSDEGAALSLALKASRPLAAALHLGRRETLALYNALSDETEALARLPLRRQVDGKERAELTARVEALRGSPRTILLGLMIPALGKAAESVAVTRELLAIAQLALGCTRAHRETGSWPTSLTDLAPGYLPQPPVDPWSDAPPRIRSVEAWEVYSIGRDRIDADGATPSPDVLGRSLLSEPGDPTLFRPEGTLTRWLRYDDE
ncbi:MAG: DUF1700 domain-containing protein [Phycisphaerales bacterium]